MRYAALLLPLLLSACAVLESEEPLFGANLIAEARPAEGLWAMLEDDACPLPTSADLSRWPDCATPLQVSAGSVRYLGPNPQVSRRPVGWLIARGDPLIVQVTSESGRSSYGWMRAQGGPADVRRARLAALYCPGAEADVAGVRLVADDGCRAETRGAVRRAAALQVGEGAPAVWIAPAAISR